MDYTPEQLREWAIQRSGSYNASKTFFDEAHQLRAHADKIEECERGKRILRELLESTLSQYPPYEAGKEAQDAWADRRAKARNDAAFALKETK